MFCRLKDFRIVHCPDAPEPPLCQMRLFEFKPLTRSRQVVAPHGFGNGILGGRSGVSKVVPANAVDSSFLCAVGLFDQEPRRRCTPQRQLGDVDLILPKLAIGGEQRLRLDLSERRMEEMRGYQSDNGLWA
jgi:hypothetical protein